MIEDQDAAQTKRIVIQYVLGLLFGARAEADQLVEVQLADSTTSLSYLSRTAFHFQIIEHKQL